MSSVAVVTGAAGLVGSEAVRFLAAENCDFAVVTTLRAAGHDVTAVAEISPRAKDPTVRGRARVSRPQAIG